MPFIRSILLIVLWGLVSSSFAAFLISPQEGSSPAAADVAPTSDAATVPVAKSAEPGVVTSDKPLQPTLTSATGIVLMPSSEGRVVREAGGGRTSAKPRLPPLIETDIGVLNRNWYEEVLLPLLPQVPPPQDIWARIRSGFGMADLTGRSYQAQLNYFAQRPDFVERVTERAGPYLYHVVAELEKRKMPLELALLPFVESAFNPNALSRARALGMWQFIPSTGRLYNLQQNLFVDERKDIVASTHAALNYLSELYQRFGDWHLALAAYNCGEGCVARAVARNIKQKKSTAFDELRLPRETRAYVPKLLAVKTIIGDPGKFAIALPEVANQPYFVEVAQGNDIDLTLAVSFAEMELDEFLTLNPQFHRPVIPAGSAILLPNERAAVFQQNLSQHEGVLSTWWPKVVDKSRRLSDLARDWQVDPALLAEANRVKQGVMLRAGSTVLVPRSVLEDDEEAGDIPSAMINNAVLHLVGEKVVKKKAKRKPVNTQTKKKTKKTTKKRNNQA